MDKQQRTRLAIAAFAATILLLVLIWFAFFTYTGTPRLRVGQPEETNTLWQIKLTTPTRGGVDLHAYRVRLTRTPMPDRLREAEIPETSAFRLNGREFERGSWISVALEPPIHIDQRKSVYLPLDLRHSFYEGLCKFDLEISYGDADDPKTLAMTELRVDARQDFR